MATVIFTLVREDTYGIYGYKQLIDLNNGNFLLKWSLGNGSPTSTKLATRRVNADRQYDNIQYGKE